MAARYQSVVLPLNGQPRFAGPRTPLLFNVCDTCLIDLLSQKDIKMGPIRGRYLHWAVTGTLLPKFTDRPPDRD